MTKRDQAQQSTCTVRQRSPQACQGTFRGIETDFKRCKSSLRALLCSPFSEEATNTPVPYLLINLFEERAHIFLIHFLLPFSIVRLAPPKFLQRARIVLLSTDTTSTNKDYRPDEDLNVRPALSIHVQFPAPK